MATETAKHSKTTEAAPEPKPAAPHATAPAAAPVIPKGPRSYLVMMLLAVLMVPSGLARAYRGEQIGWTRFWVYVGATAALIIPFLNILAGLVMLALLVWGAVDVFQLRKTKTDADGGTLVTSERDEKFANAFYIFFLVTLILSGVGLILSLAFGAFLLSLLFNGINQHRGSDYYNNPYDSSDFLRQLESETR